MSYGPNFADLLRGGRRLTKPCVGQNRAMARSINLSEFSLAAMPSPHERAGVSSLAIKGGASNE
jgi:hypothetical protein